MYEQYEGLIENFKAVHKECEAVKSSGYRDGNSSRFKSILMYDRNLNLLNGSKTKIIEVN